MWRCCASIGRCGAGQPAPTSSASTSRMRFPQAGQPAFPSGERWMTDVLKSRIRHVPDFPKPGILFYDVTTLLRDPEGFRLAIDGMSAPYVNAGIDLVVGIESRGFILGSAVADRIGAGFVPVRKV